MVCYELECIFGRRFIYVKQKCCSVAKTAVCLFVSKVFCSNLISVQLNKLFVFAFKNLLLKHKLLDGKEKKELTCTLSGKARSKLMLD